MSGLLLVTCLTSCSYGLEYFAFVAKTLLLCCRDLLLLFVLSGNRLNIRVLGHHGGFSVV